MSAIKMLQENWIGVSLAIAGNFVISISYITVKHAHNVNKQGLRPEVPYTRLPIWWLGMVLMVLGELGNFAAYGFAPASLVAPLGSSSIVFNTILAVTFLGEELRKRDIVGVLLTVGGSMMVVGFAPTDELTLTASGLMKDIEQPAFIAYFTLCILVSGVLMFFSGISVLCAKGISMFLRLLAVGRNQFSHPLPYIIMSLAFFTGLLQLIYLNKAVETFGALEVVPAYYTTFSIASIVGAVILYKELQDMKPYRIVGFSVGALLCFLGVYLINTFRPAAVGRESKQYEQVENGDKEKDKEKEKGENLEPLELEYGGGLEEEVQQDTWFARFRKKFG